MPLEEERDLFQEFGLNMERKKFLLMGRIAKVTLKEKSIVPFWRNLFLKQIIWINLRYFQLLPVEGFRVKLVP